MVQCGVRCRNWSFLPWNKITSLYKTPANVGVICVYSVSNAVESNATQRLENIERSVKSGSCIHAPVLLLTIFMFYNCMRVYCRNGIIWDVCLVTTYSRVTRKSRTCTGFCPKRKQVDPHHRRIQHKSIEQFIIRSCFKYGGKKQQLAYKKTVS